MRYPVCDPTGVTDEEREEDEIPNFAILHPVQNSTRDQTAATAIWE